MYIGHENWSTKVWFVIINVDVFAFLFKWYIVLLSCGIIIMLITSHTQRPILINSKKQYSHKIPFIPRLGKNMDKRF